MIIREVVVQDYDQISDMIVDTLHQSSSAYYCSDVIQHMVTIYSRESIGDQFNGAFGLVALSDDKIIGTGGLRGSSIFGVFISAAVQRTGVGRLIMNELELKAKLLGLKSVELCSSLQGVKFYEKLGYIHTNEGPVDGGPKGNYYHMQKYL